MASPHDLPPPPGEPGLVPVTSTVYAAPGGSYASMEFAHVHSRPNATSRHDAVVGDLVARIAFYDFSLVEAAANAVHLTRGCSPDCPFDRGTTLGLYAHQRWEDCLFSPSPNSPDPSQLMSSGSALPPLASDPMVPSPSWPSLAPPSVHSPTPSPVRLVPSGAPPSSSTNYGSAPPSSFLRGLSPGEQRLYGPGFQRDAPLTPTITLLVTCRPPPLPMQHLVLRLHPLLGPVRLPLALLALALSCRRRPPSSSDPHLSSALLPLLFPGDTCGLLVPLRPPSDPSNPPES